MFHRLIRQFFLLWSWVCGKCSAAKKLLECFIARAGQIVQARIFALLAHHDLAFPYMAETKTGADREYYNILSRKIGMVRMRPCARVSITQCDHADRIISCQMFAKHVVISALILRNEFLGESDEVVPHHPGGADADALRLVTLDLLDEPSDTLFAFGRHLHAFGVVERPAQYSQRSATRIAQPSTTHIHDRDLIRRDRTRVGH